MYDLPLRTKSPSKALAFLYLSIHCLSVETRYIYFIPWVIIQYHAILILLLKLFQLLTNGNTSEVLQAHPDFLCVLLNRGHIFKKINLEMYFSNYYIRIPLK